MLAPPFSCSPFNFSFQLTVKEIAKVYIVKTVWPEFGRAEAAFVMGVSGKGLVEDAPTASVPIAASSPSSSHQNQDAPQIHHNIGEEWAAIRIPTAFRGFLGLVRLQALVRGHAVRKQACYHPPKCMQALVRVRALVSEHGGVRMALESQAAPNRSFSNSQNKRFHVREIKVGSAWLAFRAGFLHQGYKPAGRSIRYGHQNSNPDG
nr:protein IQ-DOMAIN 1-like [Ipomoea batatas]